MKIHLFSGHRQKEYWVGAYDVYDNNTWLWYTSHGGLDSSLWKAGEPNHINVNDGSVENCGMLLSNTDEIVDTSCSKTHYPLCEFF